MMTTIEHRPEALLKIFNRYAGEQTPFAEDEDIQSDRSEWTQADKDLCAMIASAKQGERFQKLFDGEFEDYGSQSEADLAFCNTLAFWTTKDIKQMGRIFRQSELYRPKWDEQHGELTYGQMTIQKAIVGTANVYQGKASTSSTEKNMRNKFYFIPALDIIANQEPPQWIIKGYLESETVTGIFGPPECMKTFIALDMGLCVSTSTPWHGQAVFGGPVLYLCGEGKAGIGRRIEAWGESNNVTATNFYVSNMAAALLDEGSVTEVLAAAEEVTEACGSPALIIIDTLNRNFGGGDENSTQDMTKFIQAIDTIKAALKCSTLIVHHTGVADPTRGRGSSALRGAIDFEYKVVRINGETIEETAILLSASKTKDHDRPPEVTFQPVLVDLGRVDEDLNTVKSLSLETRDPLEKKKAQIKGATKIALDALKACIGEDGKAHIDTWRQESYSRAITTSDSQGAKQKAFVRASKTLLEAGHVETRDDLFWLAGQDQTKPDIVLNCLADTPDRQDTHLIGVSVSGSDKVKLDQEEDFEEFTI